MLEDCRSLEENNDVCWDGELFIFILTYSHEPDLLQYGDVLEYQYSDGSKFMGNKFINRRNGLTVWYNDNFITETIRYSELTGEEQFLFELSGRIPTRFL